jgi:hypothetical protein
MSDLTAEKWEELNSRLDSELAEAETRRHATAKKAAPFGIAALAVVVVTVALAVIIRPTEEQTLFFMPSGAAVAVLVWLFWKGRRTHALARADVERLQRDIRQWKKRKPGSVFDKQK